VQYLFLAAEAALKRSQLDIPERGNRRQVRARSAMLALEVRRLDVVVGRSPEHYQHPSESIAKQMPGNRCWAGRNIGPVSGNNHSRRIGNMSESLHTDHANAREKLER
jgi:hypothetical protein